MNCGEAGRLNGAYLDGELDLVRSLDLEDHLRQCTACASACQRQRALSHALKAADLRYVAPAALAERVRTEARAASRRVSGNSHTPWTLLSIAATTLIVVGFASGLLYDRLVRQPQGQLVAQIVAAHIRSLQADHVTDVSSSDRHTVKPWFNGKLGFAVPAVDLDAEGFELVGGRLDVLDLHQAAALVYRRRQHVINVFIRPSARAAESRARELAQQGYQLLHWTAGGMDYWAISDLNAPELNEFAIQFRARQSQ